MSGSPRDFFDHIVIITGAYGGVGQAVADMFAESGARLVLTGRDADKLHDLADRYHTRAMAVAGDIRDPATAEKVVKVAGAGWNLPATILINNAGIIHRADAQDTEDADWQRVMDVNVNGLFYMSRAFARQSTLIGGAIVNVSSTCGQVGAAGLAAYCASKGAVDQLTRTMALELAPRNITVNAVAPGAINSPMLFSKHHDLDASKTIVAKNIASIPIAAVAEPQEVARAILFLAREKHITGTILSVDGGYTAQ